MLIALNGLIILFLQFYCHPSRSYSSFSPPSRASCWPQQSHQCPTITCLPIRILRQPANICLRPPTTVSPQRPLLVPFAVRPPSSRVPHPTMEPQRLTSSHNVPVRSTELLAAHLPQANNTEHPAMTRPLLPANNTVPPATRTNSSLQCQATPLLLPCRPRTDLPAADTLIAMSVETDTPTADMRTRPSQPSTTSNTTSRIIPPATTSDIWSLAMGIRLSVVITSCCPMAGNR